MLIRLKEFRPPSLWFQISKARNGWLEGFRLRNRIAAKVLCDEKASAPNLTAEKYKGKVPEILSM